MRELSRVVARLKDTLAASLTGDILHIASWSLSLASGIVLLEEQIHLKRSIKTIFVL